MSVRTNEGGVEVLRGVIGTNPALAGRLFVLGVKLTPAERAAGEKAAKPWIEAATASRS